MNQKKNNMKKFIATAFLIAGAIGATFAQEEKPKATLSSPDQSKIEFVKTQHDFGTITEGTQATVEFKFRNTGKAPLVLTSVQASCGCTTPKWTKEPIAPGAEGSITAIYNSNGRPGNFTKTITVKHNGDGGAEYLTIRGFVQSKPKQPETPVAVPEGN